MPDDRLKRKLFGQKVGVEELMEIISLWNLRPAAMKRLEKIIRKDFRKTPHLFRYYVPAGFPDKVREFEELFAKKAGVPFALAVNSCTSALLASLAACGVGPGDEVIVPAYTFFISASIIVTARAIPVLAEIDETLTLDPADLEKKITRRAKAIIAVHMIGRPCRMDAIMRIAKKHKLKVIEDTAQACGGSYKGKFLGSFGDCGCFSFDPFKILTCGEGGVITLKDEWLYTRCQSYQDSSACWRPDRYAKERKPGEIFCGENYRQSQVHAAIGIAQLRKLDMIIRSLRENRDRIIAGIRKSGKFRIVPSADPKGEAGTSIVLMFNNAKEAEKAGSALAGAGISSGRLYSPRLRDWHTYPYWEHIIGKKTITKEGCPFTCSFYKGKLPRYSADMCPRTSDILGRSVAIWVSPAFGAQDCRQIAEAINTVESCPKGIPSGNVKS